LNLLSFADEEKEEEALPSIKMKSAHSFSELGKKNKQT